MVTFPELRALIAKYGLGQEDMGKLIGCSYQTFGSKLRCTSKFTYKDMLVIYDFFTGKGEEITMDKLFFEWQFTKVNHEKEVL